MGFFSKKKLVTTFIGWLVFTLFKLWRLRSRAYRSIKIGASFFNNTIGKIINNTCLLCTQQSTCETQLNKHYLIDGLTFLFWGIHFGLSFIPKTSIPEALQHIWGMLFVDYFYHISQLILIGGILGGIGQIMTRGWGNPKCRR